MPINNIEKSIIDAARKVFIKKGYHGTKLKDIAIEANVNQALLHYYYRSKDKLFDIVLIEVCSIIKNKLILVLKDEDDIETIIKNIIDGYVEILIENPYIPNFILNELTRNSDKVLMHLFGNEIYTFTVLRKIIKIRKKLTLEKFNQLETMNLILNVISLNIFPSLIRPLIMKVFKLNDIQFDMYMNNRKQDLFLFILKGLNI